MNNKILSLATQLFDGDREAALVWLTTDQVALGNQKPIDIGNTEDGIKKVEILIHQLMHGVFI